MSYKWKLLIAVLGGTLMVMIDATIVNIAMPHILAVFNDTIDRLQFVASAYMMATAISAPAAAWLASRFGIKRIYLASQVGFLIGSMACGLAWNTNSLIAFRILQGLSGGLLMPLGMTLIFTNVPKQEQGTAMGIFGVPMILAPTLGTTLGGYLVQYWDWRMCFYVNVPVVILAFILGLTWIKETPRRADLPLDWKGFIFAALAFGSILMALSYAPSYGWTDDRILGGFALGMISLLLWIYVELHEKVPMVNLKVFKFRGYTIGTIVNFVTTIGLFSSMFLLPLFLQNIRGMGAFQAGLLLVPQAIGSMFGTIIGGRLYDKLGPRVPTVAGLLLTAITTFKLAGLDVTTPDSDLRLILVARGLSLGMAMMPVMTYALSEVPIELTGQASSLTNLFRSVFSSLGIAIFASLLDAFKNNNMGQMTQTTGLDSVYTAQFMSGIQVVMQKAGMTYEAARQLAVLMLYQLTLVRAYVMAFDKAFLIGSIVLLIGIVPAMLMHHRNNKKPGEARAMSIEG